jgi:hypothetical protein
MLNHIHMNFFSQYQEFKDVSMKKKIVTSLTVQLLSYKKHLQLIVFICYEC